jgi:hypothetical protein
MAILRGDVQGVIIRSEKALDSLALLADTLMLARTMEVQGELHYRMSDIDEAQRLWHDAKSLRARKFGERSPEYGVALAYEARYHDYMSASQHDHQAVALKMADQAVHLIRSGQGKVSAHELLLALRERAYAFKVGRGPTGSNDDPELKAARELFTGALREAVALEDRVWMAQLHHDIGNTYTDRVIPLRGQPALHAQAVEKAQHYYRRSLALLKEAGLGVSEAAMMEHFTLGLLYQYAYKTDSLGQAIRELDEALLIMLGMAGGPSGGSPVRFEPDALNRAQMIELYHYRTKFLLERFEQGQGQGFLDEAIRTNEVAMTYWEALLREYRSLAIHKVIGSYGHFPFRQGALVHALKYWQSGLQQDAVRSLMYSDLNRSIHRQRRMVEEGGSYRLDRIAQAGKQLPRARKGQLVIAYHEEARTMAYVLDEQGVEIIELAPIPADLWRSYGQFNELNIGAWGSDPKSYAEQAFRYHQALLEPVLRGRPERDLVIMPVGSLANLPFEALTMAPDAGSWSSMPYVGSAYNIRYATSLEQALEPRAVPVTGTALLGLVEHDTISDLPFAEQLVQWLGGALGGSHVQTNLSAAGLHEALLRPGLLHIATHAHAPDQPDALPYLMTRDGILRADELWGRDVKRQLVVLSTCSSGNGRVFHGQGTLSMGSSLLDAGALAVVHTLWPVDDRATSEILKGMYEGLMDGLAISSALHRSKLRFIETHADDGLAHPFYWSGVVLTGGEVAMPERGLKGPWYLLVLLPIGLMLLWAYRRSRRERTRPAI